MQLGALIGLIASMSTHVSHNQSKLLLMCKLFVIRKYNSSDVKQACDGAGIAIVCLGTGKYHAANQNEKNG